MAPQHPYLVKHRIPAVDTVALAAIIAQTQCDNGEIPWWPGGKTDPWDHVEAAMGLTIGGHWHLSRKAFLWLQEGQLANGGWYAAYENGVPSDRTQETHHAAYLAVGLYHYYLVTGDLEFVRRLWPTLEGALSFVLQRQAPGGEIYWALNPEGACDPMALLAGCSSICLSLKCALVLAQAMEQPRPIWRQALTRLQDAIQNKPHHFNMTKARFSMDWFYPIMGGAVTGAAARERIDHYWKKYVIQDMGVRCVSDQPWVTIAESCELVLALSAMGNPSQAQIVFDWICDRTYDDGTFWCGFTYPDMVIWPEEKISWTNAVVLMAVDALYELTPGAKLFDHGYWEDMNI